MFGYQLAVVFVRCHHINFETFFFGLLGNRADDIVGFIARNFQYRDIVGFYDIFDERDRLTDIFRRLLPLRLVLFVGFVAESRTFRVEAYRNMGRVFTFQDIFQTVDKTEDGRSVHAFGVDTRVLDKSVVRPINQCICIYEE